MKIGPSSPGSTCSLKIVVHQLRPGRRVARPRGRAAAAPAAATARSGWASTSIPVARSIASASDSRGQRPARSSALPCVLDLQRAAHRQRDLLDQRLGEIHHVAVVRIRLVALHHRELGIVLARDALVAEVVADLVDAIEPAGDQPLEIQLVRDAQVEILVVAVVMGRERPRGRAAVQRLERRRLHLEEAAAIEAGAQRRDDAAAQQRRAPRLLVHQQVEVALAEARLDVGEPVPLLGQRTQALREQLGLLRVDA